MKPPIRSLVADALYPTKSYNLPSVCERYGLEPGDKEEAFASKTKYVMRRLEKLTDKAVFDIAKNVIEDFPHDQLQAAIELLDRQCHRITDLSRHHLAEALDEFSLSGKRDLLEMLRNHWPSIDKTGSYRVFDETLADDIHQHAVRINDWANREILERIGFLTCSQAKLFEFLEDVLDPIRHNHDEQERIVAKLNPILLRDGYRLTASDRVSGYPVYKVRETAAAGVQPADDLISETLVSFDDSGVHHAWKKALDRRASDPEGAITAAKTLLETVCKHIIDEAGKTYGENDDLPKLYSTAAECLSLAPSQHTETVFKSILGNCQSVVGNLAGLRNKLGDSHGQGKRHVKPQSRHAELAVNLAGSVAVFLVSTWNARKSQAKTPAADAKGTSTHAA
jgi:hypothetical protein